MPQRLKTFNPADWKHVMPLDAAFPDHEARGAWVQAKAAWLEARGIGFVEHLLEQRVARLREAGVPDVVEVRRALRGRGAVPVAEPEGTE